jgi:signal transduction histidine kinase
MERLELQRAIPTFEPNSQICEAVSLFQLFYTSLFHLRKGIIEAHGGKIWGENNPDGRGATFSFSLPLEENQ